MIRFECRCDHKKTFYALLYEACGLQSHHFTYYESQSFPKDNAFICVKIAHCIRNAPMTYANRVMLTTLLWECIVKKFLERISFDKSAKFNFSVSVSIRATCLPVTCYIIFFFYWYHRYLCSISIAYTRKINCNNKNKHDDACTNQTRFTHLYSKTMES